MTFGSEHPPAVPAERRAVGRSWLGAGLALTGVVLMFLGWWGVSGVATIGEQMPYLVSGSIPGAALLVVAAIVVLHESDQRAVQRSNALITELYALLVEEIPTVVSQAPSDVPDTPDTLVALPAGEHYHRPGCMLVAGKAGVAMVDAETIGRRTLAPCPVCEPRPAV